MWALRVDHHFHGPCAGCGSSLEQIRSEISDLKGLLMTTQTELAAAIGAVTATVAKIEGETRTLLSRIEALADELASAGNVTPEVAAALADLQAQVAVVDDLVPDEAPPPAEAGEGA